MLYLLLYYEAYYLKVDFPIDIAFSIPDNINNISQKEGINKYVSNQDILFIKKYLGRALKRAQKKFYSILIWRPPFGQFLEDAIIDNKICGRCQVTYDKDKVLSQHVKAIVFHFDETFLDTLPLKRNPDQLYVWWSSESPPSLRDVRGLPLSEFDNIFNLTMSYRRDSDVFFPYGLSAFILREILVNGSGNQNQAIDELVSKKSALAVWIVTDCYDTEGASLRWWLVNSLVDAGLKLDRYGGCFPDFFFQSKEIIRKYKFYLAFENSYHCRDYITEKVFENSFLYDAVPLVWGSTKSSYEEILPPNSFIYMEDFEKIDDAVNYLNFLDQHDIAYKQYFKWRTMEVYDMPMHNRMGGFCQLCRILHGINIDNIYHTNYKEVSRNVPLLGYSKTPRIVPSLRNWFYEESRDCLPKLNQWPQFIEKNTTQNLLNTFIN